MPLWSGGECTLPPPPAPYSWLWMLSHVCNPLPKSHAVSLQIKQWQCVCNMICPFVQDFLLWILIWPPPTAHLFRVSLGLSNHKYVACQKACQVMMSKYSANSLWWMGKLRCEALERRHLCFTKQIHLSWLIVFLFVSLFLKGFSMGSSNNQSVCNPPLRKFHLSLG